MQYEISLTGFAFPECSSLGAIYVGRIAFSLPIRPLEISMQPLRLVYSLPVRFSASNSPTPALFVRRSTTMCLKAGLSALLLFPPVFHNHVAP